MHLDRLPAASVVMREVSDDPTATSTRETMELPAEVREFCAQRQIEEEVAETLVLARRHFVIVGKPEFQVVDDPESGEHYLRIDIQAVGQPEEVFEQSDAFLDSFLASIDKNKQNYINLVYHSKQE